MCQTATYIERVMNCKSFVACNESPLKSALEHCLRAASLGTVTYRFV